MAATKHIAGNAIEHDTSSCWWDTYTGTAEALTEAGLVRVDQLPGLPGVNKTMRTFAPDGRDARKGQNFRGFPGAMQIIKKGRRFVVNIAVGEDEHERRLAEQHKQIEAEREQMTRDRWHADMARMAREAGMTVEQWLLRDVPTSAEQFRENACGFAEALLEAVERRMLGRFGYSFDAAARAQCEALTAGLMRLFEHGRIVFDKAAHEQAVTETLAAGSVVRQAERPKPALRVVKS